MRIHLLAALVLLGCNTESYDYSGFQMDDYMALDGERWWRYASESEEWKLEIEKVLPVQKKGTTEVVTLEYSVYDPSELLFSLDWSSDSSNGILIHGYSVEGGDTVVFDEPAIISEFRAVKGDVFTTETGAGTVTSTFSTVEGCPNLWVSEPWDCVVMIIDDGGVGMPFAGTWSLAADWGPSRILFDGDSDPWVLAEGHWAALED